MDSEIKIDFRDKKPVTEQIHAEMRERIERGWLVPGDRLPTVRFLAGQLKVNFNTVARAYRLLDQEGLITTRQGRGTFVVDSGETGSGESIEETPEPQGASSPTPVRDITATLSEEQATIVKAGGAKTRSLERIAAWIKEEMQRSNLALEEVLTFLRQSTQRRSIKNRRRVVHHTRQKGASLAARKQSKSAALLPNENKQYRRKRSIRARGKQ